MATEKKEKTPKAPKVKELTVKDALTWAMKASTTKQDTPAFAHVFFGHGQVRCSNGFIAAGAACDTGGTVTVGVADLKQAVKAAGKAALKLTVQQGGLLVEAGPFSTTLESADDMVFPFSDPAGTESIIAFDPLPGLKEGLAFVLEKATEDKPFLTTVMWEPTGVLTMSDAFVVHQGWAGGGLYGSTVTLSEAFVKVIVKEKIRPSRWFCDGRTITALWADGRWLQGPSTDGSQFKSRITETDYFKEYEEVSFVNIPESAGAGATSLLATGADKLYYDGAGKLWSLPTEDGPSVDVDLGSVRFMVEGSVFPRVAAVGTEWCLRVGGWLPSYYRGASCRGVFMLYPHERVLPREEGQAEVGAGLADETGEV